MAFFSGCGLSTGRLTLIKDSVSAPGDFIIFESLRSALKGEYSVVLVLVKETLAHYQYVLRKLGISAAALQQQGKLAVVNLLATHPQKQDNYLNTLWQIKHEVERMRSSGNLSIVIESLSDLRYLLCASDDRAWNQVLVELLALDEDMNEGHCGMALLGHKDVSDDEAWLKYLEHSVQDVIETEPLSSGQSLEVTGQVRIVHREPPSASDLLEKETLFEPSSTLLYKLTDLGAKIVEPGHGVL